MKNVHHHLKLRRGSSPQAEMRDGFVKWVRGLRPAGDSAEMSKEEPKHGSHVREGIPADGPRTPKTGS